jgi:hypothetical protein
MARKLAYCGIDCTTCEEYLATEEGASEGCVELLAYWKCEYPDITYDEVTCYGCREAGARLFFLCEKCEIRRCARQRGVETCADCTDYPCKKLEHHLALFPSAKRNLEMIRRSFEDEQFSDK